MSVDKTEGTAALGGLPRQITLRTLAGDLSGGVAATLVTIPQSMGLGLLAFAVLGPEWAAVGVVAGLLSTVVGCFVSGVLPAATCHMIGARTSAAVVFAGILAALVEHPLLQTAQGPDVPQVLTLAFMTVFLSGLFQMGFGVLGLGRTIKFVPYPVIAGFMNGIAMLMLVSQVGPALGASGGLSVADLWRDPGLIRAGSLLVVTSVIVGIVVAPRITRKAPALLCGALAGTLLHYLIAAAAPTAVGPVVGALPGVDFAPRELVAMIHLSLREDIFTWLALLLPGALLLAAVASLDGLLAAVVVDPITHSRHDSNRLLKGQGAATAVAAALGAIPPVTSVHTPLAAYTAGGRTPLCALIHAALMLAALVMLGPLIAGMPVAALAGVIIYTALTLVDRWSRDLVMRIGAEGVDRREILLNLAVVMGVALSLLLFSMMLAFAVGVAVAVLLLLIRLSGSPVRRALDGTVRASLKVRSPEERAMLLPCARQIRILELEGAIFFGTADRLQSDVEALPADTRYLILDFRMVSEIDASGARALLTIGQMAARRNLRVLLSHLREGGGHGRYLKSLGIATAIGSEYWFVDLDRALEWAEDRLLDRDRFEDAPELALRDMALFDGLDAAEMQIVEGVLQRHDLQDREVVFSEGDEGDRLYLIARGSVSIKVRLDGDERARRLATFVPGVFFGDMAMIERQPRSADAFANGSRVVLYSLAANDITQLIERHPGLGVKLYRNLSRELATRLRVTSGALRALE